LRPRLLCVKSWPFVVQVFGVVTKGCSEAFVAKNFAAANGSSGVWVVKNTHQLGIITHTNRLPATPRRTGSVTTC